MSNFLLSHGLYSPWNSLGQNTGVGSLSLLQGISPIQGSNPGPSHYRQILYQLSHKGSPRILEWGSLSLLQRIFPTQALNWGLLNCRRILYQLSNQGSPWLAKPPQLHESVLFFFFQTSNSGHCLLGNKTNNDSLNRKKQLISIHKFKLASLFSHLCHKLPAYS